MQLRSGKTTQIVSVNDIDATNNARFYGKIHNGNITITMEPCTPPGTPPQGTPRSAPPGNKSKPIIVMDCTPPGTPPGTPKGTSRCAQPGNKSKPIIAKHSMTLRPRKLAPELEKEPAPQHFVSMRFADNASKPNPKSLDFKDWLVARLKGFITTFHKMTILNYKERILERTRLFGEMTAVLREHIEYITSTPSFTKFSHVLYSKLLSFKTELTLLLNGKKLPGNRESCNFSSKERALLGNVRADMVKLSVIMKPLLPELPVA
jgi:hypothetical protein